MGTRTPGKNTGKTSVSKVRGTKTTLSAEMPNNVALAIEASKSIEQSRLAVENLIAATPIDDNHTLGLLSPILAELRNAQAMIDGLSQHTA